MTQAGFLSADTVYLGHVYKKTRHCEAKVNQLITFCTVLHVSLFLSDFCFVFLFLFFFFFFFKFTVTIYNTSILYHKLIIILNTILDSHQEVLYKNRFSAKNCSTYLLYISQKHWKMSTPQKTTPLQAPTMVLVTNREQLLVITPRDNFHTFAKMYKCVQRS